MGIDAKETGAILWKILGYSMNTIIKFIRNHPILSAVSMFLLVLYIFLPSLLFFLIYSSPVLACALVYAREKLGLRFSSSGTKSYGGDNSDVKCHLKQQRSVRRNARMKVEEWDSQTSEEEKDKVILTSLYNDLLGRTPQFEESPKAVEDNEKKDVGEGEEDSLGLVSNLNVETPMVCSCEINEEKYRGLDGKEEMSNVNEDKISEIERNRRLESLIARRRARRLFKLALGQRNKLQAEDSTTITQNNNNNLQITVPKNNNNSCFEKRRNYSSDNTVMGLQVPGSAPSVLLQGRSPFDIPYDPQEERPNLTGDSFDEEFSLFNHKDIFFCRHESFCRFALFSPEHTQCMNSPVPASDISTLRKHLDLDNEYMDHSEQKLPSNGKEATTEDIDKSVESGQSGEIEVETDSNKEESDDSSCSEESDSELSRLNKSELREAICDSMDNYPGFLVNQTRNNIPSTLPRGLGAPRLDDNNVFYTRRCADSHSRTFSVASDMQVEVSEIGSPPTTVDWPDDWSNGGESYIYDTDIEREIVSNEESCKRVSHKYDSRSETGSKEENSEPETNLESKPDQKYMVVEQLRMVDNTSLLDTRSQIEEIFEQKPSSSSDVSKPTSSGKFEGSLFRTSASLSSITEEPEIILDSIDGGDSEPMNCLTEELNDHRSLPSLDSSMNNLIDIEVSDLQQSESDDLCGSPNIIDSSIIDDQQKDQVFNIIQGEHDTKNHSSEHEATQRFLDDSLDTPYIESFEREMEEEEEPNSDIFTEGITKQPENEALASDLKNSPGDIITEILQSEVQEENGWELVKNTDEKTKPMEQEKTHNVLKASSSHPHTQLVEDYENAENASDVILLQVQDDNNSTVNKSTDQEISKEGEKPGFLEAVYAELTPEYNNRADVQDESVVSADTLNSQGSQPWIQQCGINSSEEISPGTLKFIQQPEHEDVIATNTVSQDLVKDDFAAVAKESAASENNDEEQVGEAMEKELVPNLESLHNNTDLVAKEEDEESKKMIGAMHSAETEEMKTEF